MKRTKETKTHKYYEGHKRSLAKTITYRILIILTTFFVAQYITRDSTTAISITLSANLINTAVYYFHERFWNGIHWGKSKNE